MSVGKSAPNSPSPLDILQAELAATKQKLAEANKKLAEQTSKSAQMEIKRDVAVSSLQLSQENHRAATKALSIACGEIKELREQVAKAKEEGRAESQARIKVLEDAFYVNMLRAFPEKSHDEIKAEIARITTTSPTASLDKVVREQMEKQERCPYCDNTGDVHRADGEYLGECKECAHPPVPDGKVLDNIKITDAMAKAGAEMFEATLHSSADFEHHACHVFEAMLKAEQQGEEDETS